MGKGEKRGVVVVVGVRRRGEVRWGEGRGEEETGEEWEKDEGVGLGEVSESAKRLQRRRKEKQARYLEEMRKALGKEEKGGGEVKGKEEGERLDGPSASEITVFRTSHGVVSVFSETVQRIVNHRVSQGAPYRLLLSYGAGEVGIAVALASLVANLTARCGMSSLVVDLEKLRGFRVGGPRDGRGSVCGGTYPS